MVQRAVTAFYRLRGYMGYTPELWLFPPLPSFWEISLTRKRKKKKKQESILLWYYHISQWQHSVAEQGSSLPSASSRTGSRCSLLLFCINEHALLFLSLVATFQLIRLSLGSSFRRALPRDISCLFKCCCAVRLKKQICCFQLELFISQHRGTTYSRTKGRKTDNTKLRTSLGTIFRSHSPFSCMCPFYSGSNSEFKQGLHKPCENSFLFSPWHYDSFVSSTKLC